MGPGTDMRSEVEEGFCCCGVDSFEDLFETAEVGVECDVVGQGLFKGVE